MCLSVNYLMLRSRLFQRRMLVFLFALFCLVCIGTSCRSSSSGEGANAAKQYWDKSVIQCGNSYFGRQKGYGIGTGFIGEFKGFKYSVDESPITESDKLNGIEWKGTTAMGCDANRVDSLFLSPWSDCRGPNGALQSAVALEKKNGRWYYHLSPFDAGIEADKYPSQLTCGEVPMAVFSK